MNVIVNKSESKSATFYTITSPETNVVCCRKISRTVQLKSKPMAFYKGVGTLFNIPGKARRARASSKWADYYAIRLDWERVGQSIYDAVIKFNQLNYGK